MTKSTNTARREQTGNTPKKTPVKITIKTGLRAGKRPPPHICLECAAP